MMVSYLPFAKPSLRNLKSTYANPANTLVEKQNENQANIAFANAGIFKPQSLNAA